MRIRISKRGVLIVLIAAVVFIPIGAAATHIFTDVSDFNTHAAGIEWVANAGVTAGCGDGTTYCPNDDVTRAQMATYMHRLSGNAPGVEPSVDAATLDGLVSGDFVTSADILGTLVVTTVSETTEFGIAGFRTVLVSCPPGTATIGGGASVESGLGAGVKAGMLNTSGPLTDGSGTPTGWIAEASEPLGLPDPDGNWSLTATAICLASS